MVAKNEKYEVLKSKPWDVFNRKTLQNMQMYHYSGQKYQFTNLKSGDSWDDSPYYPWSTVRSH